MHKQLRIDTENKQQLANKMLEKSQRDLQEFQGIKAVVQDVLTKVRELNRENNFSPKLYAAYHGVDR